MSRRSKMDARPLAAVLGVGALLGFGALAPSGALSLRFGPILVAFAPERGSAVAQLPSGVSVEVGHRRLGMTLGAGEGA